MLSSRMLIAAAGSAARTQEGAMAKREDQEIRESVRRRYASLARQQNQPEAPVPVSCCPSSPIDVSGRFLAAAGREAYSQDELKGIPDGARDFSLGCGNPTAVAGFVPGETVLDLGSGGGLDCFLAARSVGPSGRVIGLDMTPEMVELARENARKAGLGNVEFRLGAMEQMPVDSSSVDVILSNCVVNLSPDKDAVFREAYRVLKPGGRLCVSDIVTLRQLPEAVRADMALWASCVAGALHPDEYLAKLEAACFEDAAVQMESSSGQSCCCSSSEEPTPGDWAAALASMRVTAFKPMK